MVRLTAQREPSESPSPGGRAAKARSRAAWLAWALCGVSLALLGLTLVVVLLGWSSALPEGFTPSEGQAIYAVGLIGTPVLGVIIVLRLPRNPYGWVWLGFGLSFALFIFAQSYAAYAAANPGALPALRMAERVGTMGCMVALIFLPLLLLLFLKGKLPSRRWRFLAWIVAATGVFVVVVGAFRPVQSGEVGPGGESLGVGVLWARQGCMFSWLLDCSRCSQSSSAIVAPEVWSASRSSGLPTPPL